MVSARCRALFGRLRREGVTAYKSRVQNPKRCWQGLSLLSRSPGKGGRGLDNAQEMEVHLENLGKGDGHPFGTTRRWWLRRQSLLLQELLRKLEETGTASVQMASSS